MSSLIGTTLQGEYTITERLAAGGMAEVFLADEPKLKRQVVVKVMRSDLLQDPTFADRFRREAWATARLQHPNVIPIYTTGELADGRLYLVMQYVSGGTLRKLLSDLAEEDALLSTPAALFLAQQIAGALQTAHEHGIIHRDLKPGNILLTRSGTPVVTDLGIAAMPSGDTRLTLTGALLGTPAYMPPEQIHMSDEHPVDGRSDVYALGIILYEMLVGHPPFYRGASEGIIYQQLNNPPPPLSKLRPDLPRDLCRLVHRCLEKQPEKRWQSMAALNQALDGMLLRHGSAPAAQTSDTGKQRLLAERVPRAQVVRPYTPPRRPVWLLPVGIAAILLLAALALWVFWPERPSAAATPRVPPRSLTLETPTAAPPATAAPIVVAIVTATSPPTLIPPTPTVSPTPPPTATAVPPSPTPVIIPRPDQIVYMSNQGGDMEIYVATTDGRNQRALTDNDVEDRFPAVSPDGSRILFESDREDGVWQIFVMNIDGSDVQQLTGGSQGAFRPTWSPDGQQVAYLSGSPLNIFVMDIDGRNPRQITFETMTVGSVSWSINDELAFHAGDEATSWELYRTDLNGQEPVQLTFNSTSDWSPEWSPDGGTLVYMSALPSGEPAIYLINRDGSNPRLIYNSPEYEWSPHWTPDGAQILFSKDVNGVDASAPFIMNADGSGEQQLAERGAFPSWSQAYTLPDGGAVSSGPTEAIYPLAYQCGPGGARQIYLTDPDGFWQAPLPNQFPDSIVPAFSRAGAQIVYSALVDDKWQLFRSDLDGGNRQQLTTPDQGNNYEAVWSPNNTQFAFVSDRSDDRQLYVMDADGNNQQQLTTLTSYLADPTWSEDDVLAFEYDGDGRFNIVTVSASGGAVATLLSLGSASSTPAWSPDGERIAFEVAENGVRHIWIADKDGGNPTQITVDGTSNQRPAWSADGRRLAFQSNYQQPLPNLYDIWIIDIETGQAARRTFSNNCVNAAWSWTAVTLVNNP